jgi:hypothetical protein
MLHFIMSYKISAFKDDSSKYADYWITPIRVLIVMYT